MLSMKERFTWLKTAVVAVSPAPVATRPTDMAWLALVKVLLEGVVHVMPSVE
jgi:hypothetical protein